MKQYIKPAIGVVAFVVGGLIARASALDNIDKLEDRYLKKTDPAPAPGDTVHVITNLEPTPHQP